MLWSTVALATTVLRLASVLSALLAFGVLMPTLLGQITDVRGRTRPLLLCVSLSLCLQVTADLLTTEVLWHIAPDTSVTAARACLARRSAQRYGRDDVWTCP